MLRKAVTPSPIVIVYYDAWETNIVVLSDIVSKSIARRRSIGRNGARIFLIDNGYVSLAFTPQGTFTEDVFLYSGDRSRGLFSQW